MSHTTLNRAVKALCAAAFLGVVIGSPAIARPDGSGGGAQQGGNATTQITDEQYRCHYLNECTGGAPAPRQSLTVDDDAIEYLQVGAGVLAGIGLAGAGMAATSRRRHGHAALPA